MGVRRGVGLLNVEVKGSNEMRETNSVASSEFLLCADHSTAALSGVEGCVAADDGFSLGAAAAGFAPDLGDGVPVVHDERCVVY